MKLLQQTGLFLASALMIVACGPGGNTVETREAEEVGEASGMTLSVDASTSKINWRGYKPSGQHYGYIPMKTGEVMVEGESLTGAKFVFDITALEIEDLEKGSENYGKLSGHLQSDDFFDAANHPEATFELTKVEPFSAGEIEDNDEFETDNTPKKDSELAQGSPTHWISGNLTMRGTTKNIKFPAVVDVSNGGVTAKAGFNIDRTNWGLMYGDESSATDKAKDQFIYNTVSVEFDIKANQ
ncbi:YceI family protein [Mongoliibacter ruber]|uniref:YceI-like domain-containing protein n=1 Tax=Mongoliibacter ruber TaxID=1750599 RepID=A0A2T0WJZ7_9BACT|nr:YceI family protein [Mongoliibacter ruber]PRY87031.1 YceI-like domain-containing protein [Mongoliibacter ruber]